MGDTLTQATTSPPPTAQVRWMSITHATVGQPKRTAKADNLIQATVFPANSPAKTLFNPGFSVPLQQSSLRGQSMARALTQASGFESTAYLKFAKL